MTDAIIIQKPASAAQQLFLLFHGVGADAGDMVPLGRHLAAAFPGAFIVSVPGTDHSDISAGRQWFSVRDITEENRPARVASAMPGFVAAVRRWQEAAGVAADATALVGFSQGGIMALESTREEAPVATRVIAIAGRFATPPDRARTDMTIHLIHGKSDTVIPYVHSVASAERLLDMGGDVTADVLPMVGHEINDEIAFLLIERLTGYIPRRLWDEAMKADPH